MPPARDPASARPRCGTPLPSPPSRRCRRAHDVTAHRRGNPDDAAASRDGGRRQRRGESGPAAPPRGPAVHSPATCGLVRTPPPRDPGRDPPRLSVSPTPERPTRAPTPPPPRSPYPLVPPSVPVPLFCPPPARRGHRDPTPPRRQRVVPGLRSWGSGRAGTGRGAGGGRGRSAGCGRSGRGRGPRGSARAARRAPRRAAPGDVCGAGTLSARHCSVPPAPHHPAAPLTAAGRARAAR